MINLSLKIGKRQFSKQKENYFKKWAHQEEERNQRTRERIELLVYTQQTVIFVMKSINHI